MITLTCDELHMGKEKSVGTPKAPKDRALELPTGAVPSTQTTTRRIVATATSAMVKGHKAGDLASGRPLLPTLTSCLALPRI